MVGSLDPHALGHLRLHFSEQEGGDAPRSLSAVEQTGRSLWLGGDEGVSIKHLTTEDHANYFERESIALTAFFALPRGTEEEVDLEGLAIDPETERLWVAGSHSWRRKRPKGGETGARTLDALGKVSRQANRYLLGSIEIKGMNDASKTPRLAERNAHALPFDGERSSLIETLRDNARLAPFLDIPSKDNGF